MESRLGPRHALVATKALDVVSGLTSVQDNELCSKLLHYVAKGFLVMIMSGTIPCNIPSSRIKGFVYYLLLPRRLLLFFKKKTTLKGDPCATYAPGREPCAAMGYVRKRHLS